MSSSKGAAGGDQPHSPYLPWAYRREERRKYKKKRPATPLPIYDDTVTIPEKMTCSDETPDQEENSVDDKKRRKSKRKRRSRRKKDDSECGSDEIPSQQSTSKTECEVEEDIKCDDAFETVINKKSANKRKQKKKISALSVTIPEPNVYREPRKSILKTSKQCVNRAETVTNAALNSNNREGGDNRNDEIKIDNRSSSPQKNKPVRSAEHKQNFEKLPPIRGSSGRNHSPDRKPYSPGSTTLICNKTTELSTPTSQLSTSTTWADLVRQTNDAGRSKCAPTTANQTLPKLSAAACAAATPSQTNNLEATNQDKKSASVKLNEYILPELSRRIISDNKSDLTFFTISPTAETSSPSLRPQQSCSNSDQSETKISSDPLSSQSESPSSHRSAHTQPINRPDGDLSTSVKKDCAEHPIKPAASYKAHSSMNAEIKPVDKTSVQLGSPNSAFVPRHACREDMRAVREDPRYCRSYAAECRSTSENEEKARLRSSGEGAGKVTVSQQNKPITLLEKNPAINFTYRPPFIIKTQPQHHQPPVVQGAIMVEDLEQPVFSGPPNMKLAYCGIPQSRLVQYKRCNGELSENLVINFPPDPSRIGPDHKILNAPITKQPIPQCKGDTNDSFQLLIPEKPQEVLSPLPLENINPSELSLVELESLDPRRTNFLTDIRMVEVQSSPLDDYSVLSNDSDEENQTPDPFNNQQTCEQSSLMAFQTIRTDPTPSCTSIAPLTLEDDPHNNARKQDNNALSSYYHYQNSNWAQQRVAASNGRVPISQMPPTWVPYYNVLYGNQTNQNWPVNSGSYSSMPPNSMAPNNLERPKAQTMCNPHQQYNCGAPSMMSSMMSSLVSSPSIWQEDCKGRRHEALIWLFQSLPKEKIVVKGNIKFSSDTTYILGTSSTSNNVVLLGMVGKVPVAVKRVPIPLYQTIKPVISHLLQPKYHMDYLAKFIAISEDDNYGYIAQELYDYTLDDYIKKLKMENRYDQRVAYRLAWQMLKGVQMLHVRCSLLHCDLKPNNVLIDSQGKVKLSDYALTPITNEGMIINYTSAPGRNCWKPNECMVNNGSNWCTMTQYTMFSDIQVAGMLVHYILTAGQHPFGDTVYEIEMNIARGWPRWKEISHEANHLIRHMLAVEPRDRPDINSVLRHPYFWSEKRRFDFLVAVGSELIEESRSNFCNQSFVPDKLNQITLQNSGNWSTQIDMRLLDEMQREYCYSNTVCDLLKFLSNLMSFYPQLSLSCRSSLGQPHIYFLSRFPYLFIPVFRVVKCTDWTNRPSLKSFI